VGRGHALDLSGFRQGQMAGCFDAIVNHRVQYNAANLLTS
jgi:hypothetical protein